MQKIKNFFTNPLYAWMLVFGVLALNGTGVYLWMNSGGPVVPDDPNRPTPEIIGELNVGHGDIVKLNVLPYKIKPDMLVSFDASWQVWTKDERGNDVEVKYDTWPDGKIQFPAWCSDRRFEVLTSCVYLFEEKIGDKSTFSFKTFLLKNFVQVGKGPNPPPTPPGPVPPTPPTPPVPDEPVFPAGEFKLAEFTYKNVMSEVKSDKRKQGATALVRSFTTVIDDIGLGKFKKSEEALEALVIRNRMTLSLVDVDSKDWDGFGSILQKRLFEIDDSLVFTNDVMKLRTAFSEIRDGLSKVK